VATLAGEVFAGLQLRFAKQPPKSLEIAIRYQYFISNQVTITSNRFFHFCPHQ
jgi:hypothetical protein